MSKVGPRAERVIYSLTLYDLILSVAVLLQIADTSQITKTQHYENHKYLFPFVLYCRSGNFRVFKFVFSCASIIIIIFARLLNSRICPPREIREKWNLANTTRSTVSITSFVPYQTFEPHPELKKVTCISKNHWANPDLHSQDLLKEYNAQSRQNIYKQVIYFTVAGGSRRQAECILSGDTLILPCKKWNESGFRPPLCTYRLNWARRTSWGWWDDWDDTVLQTQDSKFEPWRSEAEHATSRSRRLPSILTFTHGWGRNIFVSLKPPSPGTEPRTLAWKAAVLPLT